MTLLALHIAFWSQLVSLPLAVMLLCVKDEEAWARLLRVICAAGSVVVVAGLWPLVLGGS